MPARKTKFDLEFPKIINYATFSGTVDIIGQEPEHSPYIVFEIKNGGQFLTKFFIEDEDLELFALNILKSLNSKHLKQSKHGNSRNPKQARRQSN